MATMVCTRGLQSCLDSHLVDQRTFIFPPFELPLKPPPFPDPSISLIHSDQCHFQTNSPPAGMTNSGAVAGGGWSFLQSLDAGETPVSKPEPVYVHPLAKRFNPTGLSEESLTLCTENLGNETGSDVIQNNIFPPEINGEDFRSKWERKSHSNSHSHSHSHQFPPPLTTIRETESFRVRPHREEGRLIIAAVRTQATPRCFHAERSGGRLRLCLVNTEKSEEIDGGDEEIGEETETMMMKEESGDINGRVNLDQFRIASC